MIADCSAERCQANCPQNGLGRQITPNLSPDSSLLAAASVGLRGVTAGGSVTAVSATAVVVGRAIVVRVVITTVGVGVYWSTWRIVWVVQWIKEVRRSIRSSVRGSYV